MHGPTLMHLLRQQKAILSALECKKEYAEPCLAGRAWVAVCAQILAFCHTCTGAATVALVYRAKSFVIQVGRGQEEAEKGRKEKDWSPSTSQKRPRCELSSAGLRDTHKHRCCSGDVSNCIIWCLVLLCTWDRWSARVQLLISLRLALCCRMCEWSSGTWSMWWASRWSCATRTCSRQTSTLASLARSSRSERSPLLLPYIHTLAAI